jgi:hypothetical protein
LVSDKISADADNPVTGRLIGVGWKVSATTRTAARLMVL